MEWVSSVRAFAALRANISGADHPFWAAALCSPRLGRRGSAFPCFALPRRHCSTASTALGRQPECVDDQLLGRSVSLVHLPAFVLGRVSFSLCPDWNGFRSNSRLTRFGGHSLGKPTGRTFLHSEPLARADRDVSNRGTLCVRLVARHAFRQRRSRQSTLAYHSLRNAAFPGSRCGVDKLLSGLLRWSASANGPNGTSDIEGSERDWRNREGRSVGSERVSLTRHEQRQSN